MRYTGIKMKNLHEIYISVIIFVLENIFISTNAKSVPTNEYPMLTIPQGQLFGTVETDFNGNPFYSFKGIPYAQPPIGKLRFKDPRPLLKWNGTLNATKEGNKCSQYFYGNYIGDDDCLFLNVYTPELPDEPKSFHLKSVMVFIHGGSFLQNSGNSELFGGNKLMPEDVVLVTLNYRLNIQGFLKLNDNSAGVPGNAGLKDQTIALRWVQTNIAYFGGDPKRVMLFGSSAGGCSAILHMLSPMSRGLFRAVSAASGNGLAYWSMGNPVIGYQIAEQLGFDTSNATDNETLTFLQSVPQRQLIEAQLKVSAMNGNNTFYNYEIGTVIEDDEMNDGQEHFLTQMPADIVRQEAFEPMPLILGYTDAETMFILDTNQFSVMDLTDKPLNVFEKFLPPDLGLVPGSPESLEAASRMRRFYFGKVGSVMDPLYSLINMTRDVLFTHNIVKTANLFAYHSTEPVYLYRFVLVTEVNEYKLLYNFTHLKGAAHTDDNGYLFNYDGQLPLQPDSDGLRGIHRMTRMWSNLAKYCNPNGVRDMKRSQCKNGLSEPIVHRNLDESKDRELFGNVLWNPVDRTNNDTVFMSIGLELVLDVNPDSENIEFWDEMYMSTFASENQTQKTILFDSIKC